MIVKGRLLKRLENAGIQIENIEYKEFKSATSFETNTRSVAKFPCARDFKIFRFGTHSIETKDFLASKFERFRFLKDYQGIWSSTENIIECKVENVSRKMFGNQYHFRELARRLGLVDVDGEPLGRINYDQTENSYLASIGYASLDFAILSSSVFGGVRNLESAQRQITIRLENIELKTHDQAYNLLEKIANSLLFKIDLTTDLSFKLSNDDRKTMSSDIRRPEYLKDFAFPSYEYDKEPMSLYWYAKSALDMPLLRFLALYQILEFYFPIFSRRETHQTVQNIIKDPRFDPNKDSDITKILSSITYNKSQIGFGSELEQLKATIAYCLSGSDIRELIIGDSELNEYFKDKNVKKMASKGINIDGSDFDLVTDCAERIYEIRCRVVHTKASDKSYNLLLPSSPELKYLKFDTTLLETLAKKVMIASSRTLKI